MWRFTGRPPTTTSTNLMLGARLLVSNDLLAHAFAHAGLDPPRGVHGRQGSLPISSSLAFN